MTPAEIAQRGIGAVTHHSRDMTAAEKLEAMRTLRDLAVAAVVDLEEPARAEAVEDAVPDE